MNPKFVRLQERLVYENRWIQLYDDIVEMPDGNEGTYVRLQYHHNPVGVVVIPLLPDKRVLLVDVNRYAIDRFSKEFPRGGGKIGESLEQSAIRELSKETNIVPDALHSLGYLFPDNAIMTTKVGVVVANCPIDSIEHICTNPNEAIVSASFLPLTDVWSMVASGDITDGFTLGALALYEAKEHGAPHKELREEDA
jgi:8-oxo-dGTP pyrophosphatase MutT (NUDIX family)